MKNPESRPSDCKFVVGTAQYLREQFPEMSQSKAKLHAKMLVEATDWSDRLYHRGAEDAKALKALSKSLDATITALGRVSPWIDDGLETAIHQSYMNADRTEALPYKKDQLLFVLKEWQEATGKAEAMRQGWRTGHGANWRAVALIDEARKFWEATTKRAAPPRQLRDDSKFGEFLDGLLPCAGVHANVENAYRRWSDIAHLDGSPFDGPERREI